MIRHLLIIFLLLANGIWMQAISQAKEEQQPYANLRSRMIAVQPGLIKIDSLSVVPETFVIKGVSASMYRLDAINATVQWISYPAQDSVQAVYRVFNTPLTGMVARFRYDSIADFFRAAPPVRALPGARDVAADKFIDFGNLTYTGSFGRSLAFGNTQDAVVNSLFNLQINGMLGDSIEIAAAITDNNIPILPDGTTQQLNEFDRIWLQFKKKPWELNIGDIDIRQQPSYFMSYFKRQQGMAFQTDMKLGKKVTNRMLASGAIAKGKFTRNIVVGQEGNQGPYRLTGANNELFFVVLPGTERVFIDGIQQQRGEDQDYIINYNTAEITFTPRQLINKDKRIQVEFEYADRNYLNSLLFLGNEFKVGSRLDVNLAFYANTDAKNSQINQTLNPLELQFLSEVGDSIQNAFYPSAVRDTFDIGKILYVKVDTVVNGNSYQIYRYKAVPDTSMFNLSFAEIGVGRGNYIPSLNAANGKVYEWVVPINGNPQGNYEPVIRLVTPKQQQMATTSIKYRISDKTTITTDAAISRWDVNTLSAKDKANDLGAGIKLMVGDKRTMQIKNKPHTLLTTAGYEYVDEQFKPLERLRTIEFLRDWGLPFESLATNEQLPTASLQLIADEKHQFQYQYTGYLRGDGYNGHRHRVDHFAELKGWRLINVFALTQISSDFAKGYFLRPSIAVAKTLEKFKQHEIGLSFGLEHNELLAPSHDTLLQSSFSFRDWNAYLRSNQAKPNRWSLSWFSRANQLPVHAAFVPLDVNHTITGLFEMMKSPKHRWRINATYRNLNIKTTGLTAQQPEESLLGRTEYMVNEFKGALTGNLLYEIGAGQEQRRDFSYVEVPAGRGEFTWIDYNNDGVPQLNEFELAQFTDQANYIRLFTPTNQFVRAAYNTLNYSLNFSPRLLWRSSTIPWQKFLAKVSAQSALQTSRKQINDGEFQFNPFSGDVSDTNLITLNINHANTLSFNRFSTKWGADVTSVRNVIKSLLTYGFETREINDYSLRLRKNFGRQLTTEIAGRKGFNQLVTPNPKFDNRNFNIDYYSIEPKLTFTKGTVFRTALSYKYDNKQATSAAGPQDGLIHSLAIESKYNVVQSSVLNGKFTFSQIGFEGPTNSTVAFIMLEGLQPGRNLLWNIDFTRRLANSFEISFNYEGRKAGETRTVHIGRAALRAIL